MGMTTPAVTDLLPLVNRIERKSNNFNFTSFYARMLAYVNAILSSIAMYTMGTIEINPQTLEQIERIQRRCLWRKKNR
jgi:hypothetical protein